MEKIMGLVKKRLLIPPIKFGKARSSTEGKIILGDKFLQLREYIFSSTIVIPKGIGEGFSFFVA